MHKYITSKNINNIKKRFYNKVLPEPNTGCWLWTAYTDKQMGYGWFRVTSKQRMSPAHRVSWILNIGKIPASLFVLHKCDVPSCVNPAHLFLGTQQDNVSDCISKGRFRPMYKGEEHYNSKLTEELVLKIRALYKTNSFSQSALAKKFKISKSAVKHVLKNRSWKHI